MVLRSNSFILPKRKLNAKEERGAASASGRNLLEGASQNLCIPKGQYWTVKGNKMQSMRMPFSLLVNFSFKA